MNAQAARSRRLPTGRRGNTPGGSLRIVLGLAANTNSIICDGSREPETANGCPVLHRMRGPSAVRHSCATLNPDQSNARSPERAQRPRVFFLTLTYMDVGNPDIYRYAFAGSSPYSERSGTPGHSIRRSLGKKPRVAVHVCAQELLFAGGGLGTCSQHLGIWARFDLPF